MADAYTVAKVRGGQGLPPDHHAAPDAGPKRQADDVVDAPSRAEAPLGQGRGFSVVRAPHWQAEAPLELCAERIPLDAKDLAGQVSGPELRLDDARQGDPEADGAGTTCRDV